MLWKWLHYLNASANITDSKQQIENGNLLIYKPVLLNFCVVFKFPKF